MFVLAIMEGRLYQTLAVFLMTTIIVTVNSRSIDGSEEEERAVNGQNVNEIQPSVVRILSAEDNDLISEQNVEKRNPNLARRLFAHENSEIPANTVSGENYVILTHFSLIKL